MDSQQPCSKNTEQLICPQQISYLALPVDLKKEVFTKSKMKDSSNHIVKATDADYWTLTSLSTCNCQDSLCQCSL